MKKYIPLIIISFMLSSAIKAQSFQLIVNNSNAISSISRTDASAYFLKKKKKWADNTKVIPVDLSSKSSVRTGFSKGVHKKSTSQVRAFWQQSVFAGKASPPREMKNDAAAINYVKANKGAIAYISSNTKATGVKVITIK